MATTKPVFTFALPDPYEQQMLEVKRRQQLADMLQQQVAQGITPQQGRMASKINPLAGIAQVLESSMAGYNRRKADEAQLAANRADMQSAMEFYKNVPTSRDVYGEGPAAGLTADQAGAINLDPRIKQAAPSQGLNVPTDLAGVLAQFAPGAGVLKPEQPQPTYTNPKMAQVPVSQQDRDMYLMGGLLGSPSTRMFAQAMMAKKPTEYEGGIHYTGPDSGSRPYLISKSGEIKFLDPKVFTPRDQFSTQTAEGIANRAQAQQHWKGLSGAQQWEIMQRARSGEIEARKLLDDAGVYVPIGAGLPAVNPTGMAGPMRTGYQPGGQGSVVPIANRVAPQTGVPSAGISVSQPGMPPINTAGMSPKQQRELAAKNAEAQREAQVSLPDTITKAVNAIHVIDQMLGTKGLTKEEIKSRFASKEAPEGAQKSPHPGFENYVGSTWFPFSKFEGTDATDFKTLYDQIKGQGFLEAFNGLKGGGQITEVEGNKATEALMRLNKASSEKAFIEAAREFQRNVILGMEKAKAKAAGQPIPQQGFKQQYPGGVTSSNWGS